MHLYHKNTKNIILSYLSDLTLVSDREGIDNPLSRWLRGAICFVQVLGDLHVVSYWIDTLVLKNRGKYLRYFAASPFPLQGKTKHAQDVAEIIHENLNNLFTKIREYSSHTSLKGSRCIA